jgi:4-amino-4-deoxy-L-arabinose transferase-like glycosyltransferase
VNTLRRLPPRALWGSALGAILVLALLLRLWGIKSGLPYVYDTDEDQHFVPHAIALLGHEGNPNYFDNPPAFTYVLAIVFELYFGGRAALSHAFAVNPTEVWVLARVLTALLGVLAVWLLYLVAQRLFERRVALLSAALMAVAFLPVFYSKLALNDVPTLVPLELSLWASACILRTARRRYYALAGLGLGVAAATKYTGGIAVLPLAAVVWLALRERSQRREVLRSAALAGALAIVAFVVCDPYSLLAFASFKAGLTHQGTESAAASGKLGLTHGSGILYYLWTLTWGVGWLPAIAALIAVPWLWFRERRLLLFFVPALAVYLVFMGIQGRYFGRWLMPVVPMICVLAAYTAVQSADAAASRLYRLRVAAPLLAGALLCAQGLVYSIHSGLVNSRADTRSLTRAWLVAHVPVGSGVVIEPVVPEEWGLDVGKPLATSNGYRWRGFPVLRQNEVGGRRVLSSGPSVTIEKYEKLLTPALIAFYEANGFCYVVTGSQQSGRAYVDPAAVPQAIAYYGALAKQGRRVYESSPYGAGAAPVAFNFDWSFDYYPLAYARPGPLMKVYRLSGGRCGST